MKIQIKSWIDGSILQISPLCLLGLHDLSGELTETEDGCDVMCGKWSITRKYKSCIRKNCTFRKVQIFFKETS